MKKKCIFCIFLFFSLSACSTLGSRGENIAIRSEYAVASNRYQDADQTWVNRLLAFPFYAAGGVLMGGGFLLSAAADSENSETEKQSEIQNLLVGLAMIGGGAVIWSLGDAIAD